MPELNGEHHPAMGGTLGVHIDTFCATKRPKQGVKMRDTGAANLLPVPPFFHPGTCSSLRVQSHISP